MSTFDNLIKEYDHDLSIFRDEYNSILKSDVPFIRVLLKYIFKTKGKNLRPLLIIISSSMLGSNSEVSYKAAALIETLHTATLVHDDVVDEAEKRRGFFTINALWKNKIAVLIGDYLLAKGLLVALDNNYFELLKLVSETTREMSEGEILQLKKARKFDIDETTYFEIIKKKTASLFGLCLKIGGYVNNCDSNSLEKLYLIGINAGIAFQIKDDLLDLTAKHQGKEKKLFADLKEQKITLPVLHAFNNSSFIEKQKYIFLIKQMKKKQKFSTNILQWLNEKKSIEYAENKMLEYKNKSIEILRTFPQNKHRDNLEKLINFLIEREF